MTSSTESAVKDAPWSGSKAPAVRSLTSRTSRQIYTRRSKRIAAKSHRNGDYGPDEQSPNSPLGEVIVYEAPDSELWAKNAERFLKGRGHEIRP